MTFLHALSPLHFFFLYITWNKNKILDFKYQISVHLVKEIEKNTRVSSFGGGDIHIEKHENR